MNRKRRHNYRGSITHETRPDGRFIQMNEGEVDDDGRQDPVRGGERGGGATAGGGEAKKGEDADAPSTSRLDGLGAEFKKRGIARWIADFISCG
jgi:hypothetical protein